MSYTVVYFNERVKQQVMSLPPGILADYIHLVDLIENHGMKLQQSARNPK